MDLDKYGVLPWVFTIRKWVFNHRFMPKLCGKCGEINQSHIFFGLKLSSDTTSELKQSIRL